MWQLSKSAIWTSDLVTLPNSVFHPICSLAKGGRADQVTQRAPFYQHDPWICLSVSAGMGTSSPLRQTPCRRDRVPWAAAWQGKTGLLSIWGSSWKKYTTTFIFHFLCHLTDWVHSWDWVDCFCVNSWGIRVWPIFSYKEFKIKYWEKSAGEWKNHAV